MVFGKFFGHVLQVRLIEHTALPVFGNERQRLGLKRMTLGKEAAQIGMHRKFIGRKTRQRTPAFSQCRIGVVRKEPMEQMLKRVEVVANGEKRGCL